MDKDLLKTINDVGFTEKESKVYLALLELSKGTVGQIAKTTELKRPIIYVVLEGLEKQGYVSQLPSKKINEYQAVDPSVILNKTKNSIKKFADLLPLLQTLHNKGEQRPKISYLETKEGIWNIWGQMNHIKDVFFVTSYKRIEKHFPGSIEGWIKEYKKGLYKMQGKHLLPNDPENMAIGKAFKKIRQKVGVLKELKDINMDFALYENKMVITSLGEKPFLVEIESQDLVDSMKPIFEIAWAKSKKI